MEGNLGAAYQLYLNSLNNSPLTSFDEWLKQNYYFTNMQKVNLPGSSNGGRRVFRFWGTCDTYPEQ